ncbi:hypothetical protein [Rhodopseudomonas sp. BR0C11]|uniref:hypothetical protein n=1 Tax=Rhodopseudomonas sp. BR0C11 TaxID=2269370 RepID=UPI0032E0205B
MTTRRIQTANPLIEVNVTANRRQLTFVTPDPDGVRFLTMQFERYSDGRKTSAALRLWLKAAICVCAFVVLVLGNVSAASAHQAPQPELVFVKTPPPVPPLNLSDDPEIMTTDSANALSPVSFRTIGCDQTTRVHLPLAEPMLDRSEPPQLRPPIAA